MYILSDNEKAFTAAMVEQAHQSSAEMFSRVIKQKVAIDILEIKVISTIEEAGKGLSESRYLSKSGPQLTMLITQIIGQASGGSFLLLSEEGKAAIRKTCPFAHLNAADRNIMEEALLKEIDNIISASVITHFSNALGLAIYGDIPQLSIFSAKELTMAMATATACKGGLGADYFLCIRARFLLEHQKEIQPCFGWILSAEFLERIRELAPENVC